MKKTTGGLFDVVNSRALKKLLAAACVISAAFQTGAAQLLTIDIHDPSAVVITATGNFPDVDYVTAGSDNFPVNLLGFYTADPGVITLGPVSSTLELQSGDVVNGLLGGRSAPGETTLILRRDAGGPDQAAFDDSSSAFIGSAVFNLSSISGFLPSIGATGDIVGDDFTTVVGTYQVVPEPSTYGVVGAMACVAFAVWRRRKKTATA